MARIYTRTGDKGETGRLDGKRVPKDDALVEVNGAIDECNSMIGVARAFAEGDDRLDGILARLQSLLIVAGTDVANIAGDRRLPGIVEDDIRALEIMIDELEAQIPPLTNFILPAGGKAPAHLHLARTSSRKVERRLAALRYARPDMPVLSAFFNRLSDALFVLARYASHRDGRQDEIWTNPRNGADME